MDGWRGECVRVLVGNLLPLKSVTRSGRYPTASVPDLAHYKELQMVANQIIKADKAEHRRWRR